MLEGTYTSPKIRRLAVVLSIPWPQAIGLAGLLWRFTAKHAPTGEIGRHDDEDIATALEWPGDSSTLRDTFEQRSSGSVATSRRSTPLEKRGRT